MTKKKITENNEEVLLRGLYASRILDQFTIIGKYDGIIVTQAEYTKMAERVVYNTDGGKLGSEYGVEHNIKHDRNGLNKIIFPVDINTGEIKKKFRSNRS